MVQIFPFRQSTFSKLKMYGQQKTFNIFMNIWLKIEQKKLQNTGICRHKAWLGRTLRDMKSPELFLELFTKQRKKYSSDIEHEYSSVKIEISFSYNSKCRLIFCGFIWIQLKTMFSKLCSSILKGLFLSERTVSLSFTFCFGVVMFCGLEIKVSLYFVLISLMFSEFVD